MNKIICDVCGTMYPETATQCPICGCAKPEDASAIPEDGAQTEVAAGAYSHARGGRFSKSNVRKRNKAATKVTKAAAVSEDPEEEASDTEEKTNDSNTGLIIAIVVLLISIVGMLCYIFFTYFAPGLFADATQPSTTVAVTTTVATQTEEPEIKCESLDLQVPNNQITLESADQAWLLNVAATPANTTDEITYTTSDPSIVLVSADGRVTPVSNGTATITVTCGDVVKQCQVVCNIAAEPTVEETTEATVAPTTEPTTAPTEPAVDITKFYIYPRTDCTIDIDETFTLLLRDGNHKKVDVTWTATVEGYFKIDGNKITGLKATPQNANEADKIRATCTYEGVEFSCIIRVRGKAPEVVVPPTEPTDYTGPTIDDPGYEISHTDVTIRGGEKFTLTLKDSNGQPVEAVWETDNPGIVSINGNVITGAVKGKTIVYFRVANYVYECIVRVSSTANNAVG